MVTICGSVRHLHTQDINNDALFKQLG